MNKKHCFFCLLLGMGLLTLFQACEDQEPRPVLDFQVSFDTVANVPDADSGISQDTAFQMAYRVTQNRDFNEQNLEPNAIKDVEIDSAKMLFRKKGGFQWLDSAVLSFDAEDLDQEVIAKKPNVPLDSPQSIAMNTVRTNLAPYIQKERFQIRLATKNRDSTRKEKAVFLQLFFTFRYEDR